MAPEAWGDQRERQYEHIKDSYQQRGVSSDEAEGRAARTVNKERSEKGETKSRQSRGLLRPHSQVGHNGLRAPTFSPHCSAVPALSRAIRRSSSHDAAPATQPPARPAR
jgi:hypothetical protein